LQDIKAISQSYFYFSSFPKKQFHHFFCSIFGPIAANIALRMFFELTSAPLEIRNSTISLLSFEIAALSGVQPNQSVAFGSAPQDMYDSASFLVVA